MALYRFLFAPVLLAVAAVVAPSPSQHAPPPRSEQHAVAPPGATAPSAPPGAGVAGPIRAR